MRAEHPTAHSLFSALSRSFFFCDDLTALPYWYDRIRDVSKLEPFEVGDELKQSRRGGFYASMLTPTAVGVVNAATRADVNQRLFDLALAVRLYRDDRDNYPSDLSELVPQYINRLPIDPFDGKPIRSSKADSGITIYSVGENTIDDGGQVMPQERERLGRDFGFRLMDPEERGLRLVDDAAPEDE